MEKELNFIGHINIDPPLNAQEKEYFNKFSNSRRMDRKKGPYFVEGSNEETDLSNEDVIDYNAAPTSQPGLWCKWIHTQDGSKLTWNGYQKFHAPKEWLEYIIVHFFGKEPVAKLVHPNAFSFLQGHTLNGIITIQDNALEYWFIIVRNNKVFVQNSLGEEEIKNDCVSRNKNYLITDILELVNTKEKLSIDYQNEYIVLNTQRDCKKYLI